MSTVTAAVVPEVRVTVCSVPSTEPAATASFVSLAASEPFATVGVNSTVERRPRRHLRPRPVGPHLLHRHRERKVVAAAGVVAE